MSVQVVTVTNRIPNRSREPYYRFELWQDSLRAHGVEPTVLGMGQHWGGLMTKPRRLRDWLRAGECKADLLIVTDSFDVVFVDSPETVADRYAEEFPNTPLLFNAEKGIFPRGELANRFSTLAAEEGKPDAPWRFLNSGWYIGRPDDILGFLTAMWVDDIADDYQRMDGSWVHPNDQGWYQTVFCAKAVPCGLDYDAKIVQCCSACELDEFDLTGERIRNKVTGTEPSVFHFNGGSKNDLLPAMLPKWGMEGYL